MHHYTTNRRVLSRTLSMAVAAALATHAGVAAAATSTELEEIVVTASKREQSLQSLSMAVTAVNEQALERAEINDISRLESLVPGLQFGQSGNEARIALRGTRQNNVGTEAEQSVGIFEDGVYVPTSTQALGSYVDVKRIEVLRGPQGTLYGRNTFGGTINVITNDPTFDRFYGSVSALYGDYDRFQLEGVLNAPVNDRLAFRFAGQLDQRDGYIENTWESGTSDDLNDADVTTWRASGSWRVTDNLLAKLKISNNDSSNNGSAIWGYQQIGGYVDGQYLPGHQYAPADATCCFDEGPWTIARNQRSNADTDNMSYTLNVDWDFPGFATVRFIGNLTDFEGSQNYDPDYSDGGDELNSGFTGWTSTQDTWSTELQLISNTDGRLEWLLGLYYYEQSANWNWLELVDGVFEVPHWDNQGDYTSDSFGAFAHARFSVTDEFRLVGGLRYAEDGKQQRNSLDWSVFPPVPIPNSGVDGSWDKVLWKAGAEYDLGDAMMTYATVSTGYRAGGINFVAPGVPLTYDPETVTAYEVGLKSKLLGNAMTLNVAAYYNDYQDMQAQSFITLGGTGGVTEFTENGGELDSQGIEVEMFWVPGGESPWTIGAQLAWSTAEFGDYNVSKVRGLGDLGGRQDLDDPTEPLLSLKGWSPALSPKLTLGAQISYDWQLANGSVLTPYFQTYYSDSYYSYDINVEGAKQDSYTRSDLRLIWTSPKGQWEANAFMLNAEDEAVLVRSVIFNPSERPELASIQSNWSNPRTWGMALKYNF